MAVVIRLARHGRHLQPYYRIVAADKQKKRDGRYLELLGNYNTRLDPPAVTLKEERVRYWVGVGARPSDTVARIIEKQIPGFWFKLEQDRTAKTRAKRAKRKAAQKKAGGGKSASEAAPKKARETAKKSAKSAAAAAKKA